MNDANIRSLASLVEHERYKRKAYPAKMIPQANTTIIPRFPIMGDSVGMAHGKMLTGIKNNAYSKI